MAFLIGGANSAADTGFSVANSCRFEDGDTAYMHKTPSGSPTSARIATVSFWFKLGNIGNNFSFFTANKAGLTHPATFKIILRDANGRLELQHDDGEAGNDYSLRTNMLFRDPSAWYHVVSAYDTTQGTASNRIKLYVNGTQVTSFSQEDYPDQNLDLWLGDTEKHSVGHDAAYDANYFDGYMAEFVYIDGSQLAASSFGEFDEDSPTIWKPKDVSGLTFGTNGFYLDFEDSANLGNDANGGTDLTEVNLAATDQATDTPTNNFCTLNPLAPVNGGAPGTLPTFSEGNTQITVGDGTARFAVGTMTTTMPYYFEVKVSAISASDSGQRIGVIDGNAISTSTVFYSLYYADGDVAASGETTVTGEDTITANDIIGVAVDLATNNNVKFYENGDLQATMSVGAAYQGLTSTPLARIINATTTFQFNFGNPTYANSSDAADANGYGAFEYAPPSGYYALCTKNLAEFG